MNTLKIYFFYLLIIFLLLNDLLALSPVSFQQDSFRYPLRNKSGESFSELIKRTIKSNGNVEDKVGFVDKNGKICEEDFDELYTKLLTNDIEFNPSHHKYIYEMTLLSTHQLFLKIKEANIMGNVNRFNTMDELIDFLSHNSSLSIHYFIYAFLMEVLLVNSDDRTKYENTLISKYAFFELIFRWNLPLKYNLIPNNMIITKYKPIKNNISA